MTATERVTKLLTSKQKHPNAEYQRCGFIDEGQIVIGERNAHRYCRITATQLAAFLISGSTRRYQDFMGHTIDVVKELVDNNYEYSIQIEGNASNESVYRTTAEENELIEAAIKRKIIKI